MSDDPRTEILTSLLDEGRTAFARVTRKDRRLYGLRNGSKDLLAFACYMLETYRLAAHIKTIAAKLQAVASGKTRRLLINMPPRHGKSLLVSQLFPAWIMGRNPQTNMIVASYNAAKAGEYTGAIRDLVEREVFRDLFADVSVRRDRRAREEWQTTAGGLVIGAGVGGPITGRGMDIGIVDDPFKDIAEGTSETIQNSVWNWYRAVFLTRLSRGGAIIVVHTRWHTNDLSGRLLAEQGQISEGGDWDVLDLPALAHTGEALWPDFMTAEELTRLRGKLGENIFMALYQQTPLDVLLRMFDHPRFAEQPPRLVVHAYWDPAFGGADFNAFVAGGADRQADPLEDQAHLCSGQIWRGPIEDAYDRVERLCRAHRVGVLYYEGNQGQRALGVELRRRGINAREVINTDNKHLRIVNNLKIHWSQVSFGSDVSEEFLRQILEYSEAARHDDAADATAGLLERLQIGRTPLHRRYAGLRDSLMARIGLL